MKAFGNFDIGCNNCDCSGFIPVLSYSIGEDIITFVDGSTLDAGDTLAGIAITVEDNDGHSISGEITTLGGSVELDTSELNQLEMHIRATISTNGGATLNPNGGCSNDFAWADARAGVNGLAAPEISFDDVEQTTLTIDWTAVDNADGYVLQRATNAGFTAGLATLYTGALLTFGDTGRTAATTYYYRVKATSSGAYYGDSAWAADDVTTDA
jgi:hypothetical protein